MPSGTGTEDGLWRTQSSESFRRKGCSAGESELENLARAFYNIEEGMAFS